MSQTIRPVQYLMQIVCMGGGLRNIKPQNGDTKGQCELCSWEEGTAYLQFSLSSLCSSCVTSGQAMESFISTSQLTWWGKHLITQLKNKNSHAGSGQSPSLASCISVSQISQETHKTTRYLHPVAIPLELDFWSSLFLKPEGSTFPSRLSSNLPNHL